MGSTKKLNSWPPFDVEQSNRGSRKLWCNERRLGSHLPGNLGISSGRARFILACRCSGCPIGGTGLSTAVGCYHSSCAQRGRIHSCKRGIAVAPGLSRPVSGSPGRRRQRRQNRERCDTRWGRRFPPDDNKHLGPRTWLDGKALGVETGYGQRGELEARLRAFHRRGYRACA